VSREEGLGHLERCRPGIRLALPHPPLAVADHPVWINGQDLAPEMPAAAADLAQGDLESLRFDHRVGFQQIVDRLVRGGERQSMGQLKILVRQGALLANPRDAQSRLVDQLHRQPRLDGLGTFTGPGTQQIPGSHTKMLGHQQPDARQIATDLVGQSLPNPLFDRARIAQRHSPASLGVVDLNPTGPGVGTMGVEFFFEGRTPR
jgi:hypothetical protein